MGRKPKDKLNAIVAQMDKLFGTGTVMKLGDQAHTDVPAVSTGSVNLDRALGIGGLPKGRMVEMFGQESSGKTTLALSVIAQVQKQGGVAAFVDAEHALDPNYAATLGVKVEDLLISQPDYGEQALEVIDALTRSQAIDIIVLDSVAALVPKAELEGAVGDSHMGLQARLMGQALRKLVPIAARNNTMIIFINQIRQKIGVMYGSNETTTGGNALKFYASVRLKVQRTGQLKDGDQVIGNRVKIKVVKNKMAPPFASAEFDLLFNKGIDRFGELLDLALSKNLLTRSGAWYSMGDRQLGRGRAQVVELLKQDAELAATIEGLLASPPTAQA